MIPVCSDVVSPCPVSPSSLSSPPSWPPPWPSPTVVTPSSNPMEDEHPVPPRLIVAPIRGLLPRLLTYPNPFRCVFSLNLSRRICCSLKPGTVAPSSPILPSPLSSLFQNALEETHRSPWSSALPTTTVPAAPPVPPVPLTSQGAP